MYFYSGFPSEPVPIVTVVKTYPNGVTVGNVPSHVSKSKRSGIEQSWFPPDWTDEDILAAGTAVVNSKAAFEPIIWEPGIISGYAKFANSMDVRIGIIADRDKQVGIVFPDREQ